MAKLVCAPIGVDESNSAYKSITSNFSNAIGKYADNTDSYAEWTMVTGGAAYTYTLWTFDVSSIPRNATINNVTCTARCYNSNSQAFYGGNTSVSLLAGMASKVISEGTKAFGTTPKEVTLSSADYSREELDNFRLKIQSTRGYLGTSNTYYTRLYGATLIVDYTVPSAQPPTITVQSQDKNKISSVSGHDRCTVSFTADQELSYWEARATLGDVTPAHGVGLLVESGTLANGETGYVYVDDEELTNGDLEYTVTIFGQNADGAWSDE